MNFGIGLTGGRGILISLACWSCFFQVGPCPAQKFSVTSPQGRIAIDVVLNSEPGNAQAKLHYSVQMDQQQVVLASSLGLELAGNKAGESEVLGESAEFVSQTTRQVRESFQQPIGKRRQVDVASNELVLKFRETSEPQRSWELAVRAADDGVAFQYRILPLKSDGEELIIRQERTHFQLPAAALLQALPLNGFTTSYEKRYQEKAVKDLPLDWLLGLPLLAELPRGYWLAISEANINEYAGMYVGPMIINGRQTRSLVSRLSPRPEESAVAVRHTAPHASPWRVILISDRPGDLIESDLILSLAEPCAIRNTSWIRTGKTTFPWWNGFFEKNVDFQPGLNTATAKYYIDFCAEAGIPYHSLAGFGSTAWYGGPIVPYRGAQPIQGVPGLDLPEVIHYAHEKGVRLRLWMNWQAAEAHMHTAFPMYQQWGIEGVMLDFMDRDDQDMNQFIRQAVALAAENRLTVTLHGCPKPVGLERTYPNLLTHEGVMNLEYNKWDKTPIDPNHEVLVPLTRMLAGPLDFHQGSFRTVTPIEFRPQMAAPLIVGTPARTLASYVVFQNHLSMVADYPSAYRGHPALPALVEIPTNWEDTQVIEAQVGQMIAIARRRGTEWHLGAMNGTDSDACNLPLDFLPMGNFTAAIWEDDSAAPNGIKLRRAVVSNQDSLDLNFGRPGGAYARLTPQTMSQQK